MTLPDQAAADVSDPTVEPAASDEAAPASSITPAVETANTFPEPIGTPAGGGALGLSTRQTQLLGLVAALVAGGCGAMLIRHRIRQRKRASVMQRLQSQAYVSAARLIATTLFVAGPLHDHHNPALDRLSPLVVEAILRRKTGATPLLLQRASRALATRKRS